MQNQYYRNYADSNSEYLSDLDVGNSEKLIQQLQDLYLALQGLPDNQIVAAFETQFEEDFEASNRSQLWDSMLDEIINDVDILIEFIATSHKLSSDMLINVLDLREDSLILTERTDEAFSFIPPATREIAWLSTDQEKLAELLEVLDAEQVSGVMRSFFVDKGKTSALAVEFAELFLITEEDSTYNSIAEGGFLPAALLTAAIVRRPDVLVLAVAELAPAFSRDVSGLIDWLDASSDRIEAHAKLYDLTMNTDLWSAIHSIVTQEAAQLTGHLRQLYEDTQANKTSDRFRSIACAVLFDTRLRIDDQTQLLFNNLYRHA